MKKLMSVLFFTVLGSSLANAYCVVNQEPGFTVAAGQSLVQNYECTNFRFQYFVRVNYMIQQGLTCYNTPWLSKVEMNCQSHSHEPRGINSVALLCCDNPQGN